MSTCPEPDKVLLHAFDRAINEACEESVSTVYKIGVRIDSEALGNSFFFDRFSYRSSEYPAGLTIDHSWKTTPYACVNLFKKIQQSKKAVDLFSFPMTIKVTVLGKQRGAGRVRKNVKLYLGINERSLIMVYFFVTIPT